jgi:acyl-CoA hydrolase
LDTHDDERHRLSMTILMTPDMSNFAGNVHGGTLLKYLDQVAYTCATRYACNYAVTLSVDQVVFREPIHVGELVTFEASVNRTGRTSMEIGIRVTTQDLVAQTVRHTITAAISRWSRSGRTAVRCPCRPGNHGRPRRSAGTGPPSVGSSYGGRSPGLSRRSGSPPRPRSQTPAPPRPGQGRSIEPTRTGQCPA